MIGDKHTVSVLFHADTPERYTARLGSGGWLEAHGWTLDEALDQLAAAIAADPSLVRDDSVDGVGAIRRWVRERASTPVLAD